MKKTIVVLTAIIAMAALPYGVAFGQVGQAGKVPSWAVDDGWRNAHYPPSEWFVGYSSDVVRAGAKLSDVQKRVETEAKQKLAEGITVRIVSETKTKTSSVQVKDGKNLNESIKKNYGQDIVSYTNAEIAKVELETYHDQPNNKIYALAKVKKSDLAAYYASFIERSQQQAENNLKLAKQFGESDRKRSAQENIAEAYKNLGECGKYTDQLNAVDAATAKRLEDKGAAIKSDIAAYETLLNESASIFVGGREVLKGEEVSYVIPGIQALLSEHGCRIADRRDESNFILTVDVKDSQKSAAGPFFYVYASVKADVRNVKTDKIDSKLNFTSKGGDMNEEAAGRVAFKEAANELWKQIREKTELCK